MLEFVVEKLSEKNLLNKAYDLIVRACSMVDTKSLINTLIDLVKKKIINPKLSETFNDLVARLIPTLTAAYLPFNELMDFSKFCFEQKSASIRKIGTTIVCALYANLGNKVKDALLDVNPSIMKTVDAEMKKVNLNLKATPMVEIFGAKLGNKAADGASGQVGQPIDVSAGLSNAIPGMENSNWQTRKEALETVMNLLAQSNYNIKPAGVDQYVLALVKRIEDSHKTPLKGAIEVCGFLAKSLGKNFKPWVRILTPGLMKNIQNKEAVIREEAVSSLTLFYDYVELERDYIVREMLNALSHESVELKQEALNFLLSHTEVLEKVDFKNSVEVILKGLESKNKQQRDSFELLLNASVEAKGEEMFMRQAKSLNPASSKLVIALLDKLAGRESVPDAPTPRLPPKDSAINRSNRDLGAKTARADVSRSRETSVSARKPDRHDDRSRSINRVPSNTNVSHAAKAHPPVANTITESIILSASTSIPGSGIMTEIVGQDLTRVVDVNQDHLH